MLQVTVDWFVYNFLGIESKLGESLNFFIYDSIKILLLLFFMILIIGFFRTYISQQKVKKWLSGKKFGSGNLVASSLGAITPFCSWGRPTGRRLDVSGGDTKHFMKHTAPQV